MFYVVCVSKFCFLLGSFISTLQCLKLWIVLKEAQTTEEKLKEASHENQDTDLRFFGTWLEHLSGYIVIHGVSQCSRGHWGSLQAVCSFSSVPAISKSRFHCSGKNGQWANSSFVRCCWKKKLQAVQPRTRCSWKHRSAILLLFAILLPCYPVWMVEREPVLFPLQVAPDFWGIVGNFIHGPGRQAKADFDAKARFCKGNRKSSDCLSLC